MEKKTYSKPLMAAQRFEPQEFISACPPDATFVTYEFWCNAGAGNQYKVWLDDGDKQFSQVRDTQLTSSGGWFSPGTVFEPCEESHTVTVRKGESIDNIFPFGWIVRYDYNGLHVNEATLVRIWRGENNDNIHCTTQLNESEYTEKNPS